MEKTKAIFAKTKLWIKDHYHLLFKSAADNHLRIQELLKNPDGTYQLTVKFGSYTELKTYQRKLRRMTVSLSSAVAMVIVAIAISPYIMNPNRSSASSFQWIQNNWSGTEGSTPAVSPTNKTGWTGYVSKDGNVNVTAAASGDHAANSVTLMLPTASTTGEANVGDSTFVANSSFYIDSTTSNLTLRKPYLATCVGSPSTECGVNLNCALGQCKKGGGQACTLASECASAECIGNACTFPVLACDGSQGAISCGNSCTYGSPSVTYQTLQIGTQCWFKQNLNVGTKIASGTYPSNTGTYPPAVNTIEKWCYDNSDANCTADGALYSWAEALGLNPSCNSSDCTAQVQVKHQGICPSGWHVSSDAELTTLENYVSANFGTAGLVGDKLKKAGLCQGRTPCGTSGFDIPLAGLWNNYSSSFGYRSVSAFVWSSTHASNQYAWARFFGAINSAVVRIYDYDGSDKLAGFSVRCIKD